MKYEITNITHPQNSNLTRIRALRDIRKHGVRAGDLGGYMSYEDNLSQDGDCWIADNAIVSGNAEVSGDQVVS